MTVGTRRVPKWESELWHYLSRGDGEVCPLYNQCRLKRQCAYCLSGNKEYIKVLNTFIDEDEITWSSHELRRFDLMLFVREGRIFRLIRKLAHMYLDKAKVQCPPVPADLIPLADDNRPIEVHLLPLKVHHGAIWRLRNRWVIQLKNDDSPARQRFTLFHEIFHILAHCRATPVFKKTGVDGGSFNEILADHFAGTILTPAEWVEEKWAEVQDLDQMTQIFEVPKTVMWVKLRVLGLI
jgi:hypothetical protein